jgi:hypothetical protein
MLMSLHFIHHSNKWKLKNVWLTGTAIGDSDGAAAQGAEMANAGPAGCYSKSCCEATRVIGDL